MNWTSKSLHPYDETLQRCIVDVSDGAVPESKGFKIGESTLDEDHWRT
jgi:hypothetical protein